MCNSQFLFYSILKNKLQWTQLNPQDVLEEVKTLKIQFPWRTMEAYMKRAGITYAYMKKPCLDPTDPQCPETAPNKKSGHVSDLNISKIHHTVTIFTYRFNSRRNLL